MGEEKILDQLKTLTQNGILSKEGFSNMLYNGIIENGSKFDDYSVGEWTNWFNRKIQSAQLNLISCVENELFVAAPYFTKMLVCKESTSNMDAKAVSTIHDKSISSLIDDLKSCVEVRIIISSKYRDVYQQALDAISEYGYSTLVYKADTFDIIIIYILDTFKF